MAGTVWTKFFWSDWESDPSLRMCSLAAQGLWMRMLCVASSNDGYVRVNGRGLEVSDIARLAGETPDATLDLLEELDRNGVYSKNRKGVIFSRRMIRDIKTAKKNSKNGSKGGNPKLRATHSKQTEKNEWDNPPDIPDDKPHKPYANCHMPEGDDGGVRRARDFAGQDLTDPNALLEAVCAIVGTSGATNPNWAVSMECANWLRSGYDPHDDILPTVEATMKRKDDGPPGSLKYFTKAIARARADRLESLNPVILERPKNARSDHRQGGSPHDGIRTGIAAAVARRMEAGVPGSGVG